MSLRPPWEFDNPSCANTDPSKYYKEDDTETLTPSDRREIKEIKELCSTCEHLSDCAEWGIEKESFGIWGGMTVDERKRIRRRRRRSGIRLSR